MKKCAFTLIHATENRSLRSGPNAAFPTISTDVTVDLWNTLGFAASDMLPCYESEHDVIPALLRQAWLWAQDRSKDPRTKVGAVVYDPVSGASFFGYNGFPKGIPDAKELWDNRDRTKPWSKYSLVVHGESNAVRKATACLRTDLSRCILVLTHFPCHRCCVDFIIPSGIKQVYVAKLDPPDPLTLALADKAGVQIFLTDYDPDTDHLGLRAQEILDPAKDHVCEIVG